MRIRFAFVFPAEFIECAVKPLPSGMGFYGAVDKEQLNYNLR
jgi:hypothetical protein